MYKPTTLKDIAKELNVSISTVSRAIAGSYHISEHTRKRIVETAEALNYRPNSLALQLRDRKSFAIGIVVPKVDNIFFSNVIDGIESVAYKKGYHVIITQSHDSFEKETFNVKRLVEDRVDGILLSLAAESVNFKHLEKVHDQGVPIVFFDRVLQSINTHKVISNNFRGAFDATNFLYQKGCKRIAFLADTEHLSIIEQRRMGYESAIKEHGLTVDLDLIRYCGLNTHNRRTVEHSIVSLMSLASPPDAMLTASEEVSRLALLQLKKFDLHHQITTIGFSNCNEANLFSPAFSCVKQKAFEMGEKSAENLIDLIENGKPKGGYKTTILETELQLNE